MEYKRRVCFQYFQIYFRRVFDSGKKVGAYELFDLIKWMR